MMPQQQKSGKGKSGRPDLSSLLGLVVAVGCILGALVWEGGKVSDVSQATAALIVAGGTVGAILVTTPFNVLSSALRRAVEVFMVRQLPFARTLDELTKYADRARKIGIASLEKCSADVDDPFLAKALTLASDAVEPASIREMMLIDLDFEQEHAEAEIKVWENAAGYAPTIGIIGAVLGLIQVMKHLENLDDVGRGIAVSFVATIYGVASANLLFLPIAGKLRARSRDLERLHEMMLEGVLGIAAGINPMFIKVRLKSFLPSGDEGATKAARVKNGAGAARPSLAAE